jgi:hypothetical protein
MSRSGRIVALAKFVKATRFSLLFSMFASTAVVWRKFGEGSPWLVLLDWVVYFLIFASLRPTAKALFDTPTNSKSEANPLGPP